MSVKLVCDTLRRQAAKLYEEAESQADKNKRIQLRVLAANYDAAALLIHKNRVEMALHATMNYVRRFGSTKS